MIRWSYGYRYLLAPEGGYKSDLENHSDNQAQRRPTMESDENTPLIRHSRQSTNHSRQTSQSDYPSDYEYSTADTSPMVPSTPLITDEEDITSFPPPNQSHSRLWHIRIHRILSIVWREFLDFMNMPLWAMLVAVAIALYPQLQHYLFFEQDGFIRGSVIFAIQTCGDVSIPLILVILGANIANEDPPVIEDSQTDPIVDRKWSLTQRQRGIILGIATRMVIVPVFTFLKWN
jgi:predicted permease